MPGWTDAAVWGMGRGAVGIDLSPHGVAIAHVGRDENPDPWSEERAQCLPAEAAAGLRKDASERPVGGGAGPDLAARA